MIVRDLITRLGFSVDTKGIESLDQTIQKAKRSILLIGTGVVALGTVFLKAAGDMEQSEIAFETMTGSAEKAQKLLEELTTFAATTPFDMKGLIENSKRLLAFGFASDEIVTKMGTLGDIAAGVGRDKLPTLVAAFGKVRVKGKASMEELNMMLEAGVPILDQLSTNMGVNTTQLLKMVSLGKVGFKDVDKALLDLRTGTGRFTNLMIKQSKSFLGLISNVGDFLEVFAISVGKELLPQAKEYVKILLEWMSANKDMIKQNIVKFFKGVFKVIVSIAKVMRSINNMTGGLKNTAKLVGIIALAFNAAAIKAAIFNATAMLIPLAIVAAIAVLGLLAEDLYQFFTGGESLTQDFVDTFKFLWASMVDYASATWHGMVDSITDSINNVINAVKGVFSKTVKVTGAGEGFRAAQNFAASSASSSSRANPSSITRAGAVNNNSKSINVNSNVTVPVPAGTPEAQKKVIKDFAAGAFSDIFRQQLNGLDLNNPVLEK